MLNSFIFYEKWYYKGNDVDSCFSINQLEMAELIIKDPAYPIKILDIKTLRGNILKSDPDNVC